MTGSFRLRLRGERLPTPRLEQVRVGDELRDIVEALVYVDVPGGGQCGAVPGLVEHGVDQVVERQPGNERTQVLDEEDPFSDVGDFVVREDAGLGGGLQALPERRAAVAGGVASDAIERGAADARQRRAGRGNARARRRRRQGRK